MAYNATYFGRLDYFCAEFQLFYFIPLNVLYVDTNAYNSAKGEFCMILEILQNAIMLMIVSLGTIAFIFVISSIFEGH